MKDKSGYEFLLIVVFLAVGGYALATMPVGCDKAGAADTVWVSPDGTPDTLSHHNLDDFYLADTRLVVTDSTNPNEYRTKPVRYMARRLRATVLGTEVKLDKAGSDALIMIAYRYSTIKDTTQRLAAINAAVQEGLK